MFRSLHVKAFLACILAGLLLSGCMSAEQRLIGKWKGTVELGRGLKYSPLGAAAGALNTMGDPQLDLRPDKTFTLFLSFAPIEGTWKLVEKEVILTPTKVMGISSEDAKARAKGMMDRVQEKGFPLGMPMPMGDIPGTQEMRVKVLNDGEKLSLDPGSGTMFGGSAKLEFKKV
ncbi:MAG: hypothetical protein QOJ65_888 [Fimbriimonadaceae bacterium]|jgi:hypothetical protein|nr:hypothetical protein [Fimbriimonadaceae bacterium]